jgi:hypothetical protein
MVRQMGSVMHNMLEDVLKVSADFLLKFAGE